MSKLLEKNIISLLREKDEKGMELLFDHYGDTLFGVANKITKDEDLAKDVVQLSLMKIWDKIDTYNDKKSKLFTWIFRITRNTAIDKIRSANLKSDQEIQIEVSDVYNLGTETVKPDHLDLRKHLDSLDSKYQVVMEALFFQGMTQQEASEALDMPLGTIKSRLKIGLRELRKIYDLASVVFIFSMMMI